MLMRVGLDMDMVRQLDMGVDVGVKVGGNGCGCDSVGKTLVRRKDETLAWKGLTVSRSAHLSQPAKPSQESQSVI